MNFPFSKFPKSNKSSKKALKHIISLHHHLLALPFQIPPTHSLPTKSNLNMLLLNLIPQLIPPPMTLPYLLLPLLDLILESVHLAQVRVGRLPALVLGFDVREGLEELFVGCGEGLEGGEDGAAGGLEVEEFGFEEGG